MLLNKQKRLMLNTERTRNEGAASIGDADRREEQGESYVPATTSLIDSLYLTLLRSGLMRVRVATFLKGQVCRSQLLPV